jgi:hypothetical protein
MSALQRGTSVATERERERGIAKGNPLTWNREANTASRDPDIAIVNCVLRVSELIYDRHSVGQTVMVSGAHLGPVTNFFFRLEISFRHLRVCKFVAPSLTRGRVCKLLYSCFCCVVH